MRMQHLHLPFTRGSDALASLLYVLLTLLGTLFSVVYFSLYTFEVINLLYILLSILASMAFFFIMFLLFLAIYGRFIRKVDPHNMRNHRIINSILRLAFHLMNAKLVVTGREHIPEKGKAFIFVCNHQENYDIMAIKPVLKDHPLNFIAKAASFDWFVLGHWIKVLGNVPIVREADRSAAESIVKGIRLYKEGIPMAIFPEGKRTFSNQMTDFKPGAFKLAVKPKADILVGTIYNFSKVFQGWPFKRQKIYLHFHPLLTYDDYKEMNTITLSNHVKGMMQKQLDAYQATIN